MSQAFEKAKFTKKGVSPLGAWAFSLGTAIGWGSFVMTSNTYLKNAGPMGTLIGMLIGMALMAVIAVNVHYMMKIVPDAGGIFAFTKKTLGYDHGFLAAWFMILTYAAMLWANLTSLPLFVRYFVGDFFRFGYMYSIAGYEVYIGEILLCLAAILGVCGIFLVSKRVTVYLQTGMALIFTAAITLVFIVATAKHEGGVATYAPAFSTDGGTPLKQITSVITMAPWAFIGFESIMHHSEEFNFPHKKVLGILLGSVLTTTVLYLFVVQISITAFPENYTSWEGYINNLGAHNGLDALPAFFVARKYLGTFGVILLGTALFCLVATSLFGNLRALSRLLFALGRDGVFPKALGKLNKHDSPIVAILVIVAASAIMPFFGRVTIGWIVDINTVGATICYGYASVCAWKTAKANSNKVVRWTGLIGFVISVCFGLMLVIPTFIGTDTLEAESYFALAIWAVAGFVIFRFVLKYDENKRFANTSIFFIGLMGMIFIILILWMVATTRSTTNDLVSIMTEHLAGGGYTLEQDAFVKALAKETNEKLVLDITLLSIMLFVSMVMVFSVFSIMRKRQIESEKAAFEAKALANTDSLTGVKSKHAYTTHEIRMNERILRGECEDFAVAVCDVNDLKYMNDTFGHEFGDKYITDACRTICVIFKHSPVYRVGGDEFVVIIEHEDFLNRVELIAKLRDFSDENVRTERGVVISMGVYEFVKGRDEDFSTVFRHADQLMYEDKKRLKQFRNYNGNR